MFYRKYRPNNLSELDTEDVKEQLASILKSITIPHAFLFTGPRGTGKTSTARIVAKILNAEINKEKITTLDIPEDDPNVKAIAEGNSADVIEKMCIRDSINGLGEFITTHMEEMQLDLLAASRKKKEEMTVDVETFEEFEKVMSENKKFIRAYWDESQVVEAKIKEKTKATTRVIEIDRILDEEDGTCVYSGNKARRKWLFAQSY